MKPFFTTEDYTGHSTNISILEASWKQSLSKVPLKTDGQETLTSKKVPPPLEIPQMEDSD